MKRYRTRHAITYTLPFYQGVIMIPGHTEVFPATNLPEDDLFWADRWEGMSAAEDSHERNYGFGVSVDDVEEILE